MGSGSHDDPDPIRCSSLGLEGLESVFGLGPIEKNCSNGIVAMDGSRVNKVRLIFERSVSFYETGL